MQNMERLYLFKLDLVYVDNNTVLRQLQPSASGQRGCCKGCEYKLGGHGSLLTIVLCDLVPRRKI